MNRAFHNLSLMLLGGATTTVLLAGFGLWRGGEGFLKTLQTWVTVTESASRVDIPTLVVQQIQGASELTTAVFTMQTVVPVERDRTLGNYVIGTTRLLYVAQGEVRAGIDLSQIRSTDVQIIEQGSQTIHLRLPPPRILDSKLDVNRSTVYDYDRGFLGLGPDVAPELQQEAQRQTLQKILETACTEGILQEANERAILTVERLLAIAGYSKVAIETQLPSPERCLLQTSVPPL